MPFQWSENSVIQAWQQSSRVPRTINLAFWKRRETEPQFKFQAIQLHGVANVPYEKVVWVRRDRL